MSVLSRTGYLLHIEIADESPARFVAIHDQRDLGIRLQRLGSSRFMDRISTLIALTLVNVAIFHTAAVTVKGNARDTPCNFYSSRK